MNYLNPYIALGGRNPFRACFVSNLNLSIQLGEKHFLLCKKLKIHVILSIFLAKNLHFCEVEHFWKIIVTRIFEETP